jgi:hypothetical protein
LSQRRRLSRPVPTGSTIPVETSRLSPGWWKQGQVEPAARIGSGDDHGNGDPPIGAQGHRASGFVCSLLPGAPLSTSAYGSGIFWRRAQCRNMAQSDRSQCATTIGPLSSIWRSFVLPEITPPGINPIPKNRVFGAYLAPLHSPNHGRRACRFSWEMRPDRRGSNFSDVSEPRRPRK